MTANNSSDKGCDRPCGGVFGSLRAFDALDPKLRLIVNFHPSKICPCQVLDIETRRGVPAAVRELVDAVVYLP